MLLLVVLLCALLSGSASSPPASSVDRRGWDPSEAALFRRLSSRCNIDRKPYITKAEFDAHYLNRKPVILGAPASPEAQESLLSHLLDNYGDAPVPLAHPFRIGEVSPSTATFSEYLASFRPLSARRAASRARQTGADAH